MGRLISIVLDDNPSTQDGFTLDFSVDSQLFSFTRTYEFINISSTITTIEIKVNVAATAVEMYDVINDALLPYPFIAVTQITNGIEIEITGEDAEGGGTVDEGDITIDNSDTIDPEPPEDVVPSDYPILSRSPYFVEINPAVPFDSATMELRLWRGDLNIDYPLLTTYNLSKLVVQAGQPVITFEIHSLINDYVKANYNGTILTGASTLSMFDTIWVEAKITAKYLEDNVATVSRRYIAVDGFGYHTELYNPIFTQKTLISTTEHIVYGNAPYPIAFMTKDLVSINCNGSSIPFTFNEEVSNQVIAYINANAYGTGDETFTATFTYPDGIDTLIQVHTITRKTECRFDVINCIFKNKYGMWQTICFNKLWKKTLDVDSEDYMPAISSYGRYSLASHQKKQYLIDGKEKISVNTDFVPEYYNIIIQELMLSEFVYLQENGVTKPVNLLKKSFLKKTRLVDKLIQYSMEFEYSYNIMNNVI